LQPCINQMVGFLITAAAAMQAMTPSQLTSMLVGCAKLRHYDHQLCSKLAEAAVAAMPGATGSQLAMMTWALAHLKLDMPQVFAAAAQQVRVTFGFQFHCWSSQLHV
jgi:hypothetical protein